MSLGAQGQMEDPVPLLAKNNEGEIGTPRLIILVEVNAGGAGQTLKVVWVRRKPTSPNQLQFRPHLTTS